ncbi:hypothetical protein ABE438_14740 [Bosea sp. TWI1241]|uniref:hypothetical protein n=1 Tax=Bosea sp. TWI1241 TaxID=3148904 RepID=UPI00320A3228
MTDIVDRTRIDYAHWQMKLGRGGASGLGRIVTALGDLEQAIHTIALTEKGSVPLAPEKCVALLQWIDRPPNEAIPNIARELWDAINTWEPRITVEQVTPIPVSASHWRFPVFWYPRADVTRELRLTEITYG